MEAAGRAVKEFGAQIIVIKKTSTQYAKENDPLPCPSVLVNSKLIAKNDIVTYEALKAAILSDSSMKES